MADFAKLYVEQTMQIVNMIHSKASQVSGGPSIWSGFGTRDASSNRMSNMFLVIISSAHNPSDPLRSQ